MFTVDYLKTLHADYVEWNTDPGSMIMPKDGFPRHRHREIV